MESPGPGRLLNGRLPENSTATPTVSCWPVRDTQPANLNDRFREVADVHARSPDWIGSTQRLVPSTEYQAVLHRRGPQQPARRTAQFEVMRPQHEVRGRDRGSKSGFRIFGRGSGACIGEYPTHVNGARRLGTFVRDRWVRTIFQALGTAYEVLRGQTKRSRTPPLGECELSDLFRPFTQLRSGRSGLL